MRSIFSYAALFILLSMATVFAAASTPAQTFVESLSKVAISTLTKRELTSAERDHRFRVLLNQNFDVPAIGRFAIGRYWRTASVDQQQEYLRLFESVIVGTYSARFSKYSGQTIQTTGIKKEVDSVLVSSKMISPDGSEPVMIDWRLKPDGDSFKIVDLIVEGVSMSTTQRSEFSSVIERNGGNVESLLNVLRKKTEKRAQAKEVTVHTD